ncbi:MAG: NAD-dependent epimerase/dehydratase family protein [Clostridiales bacterium]|nr:NAD-dependent epimerase/dehydratase family protein [Clostridiales bacterium]
MSYTDIEKQDIELIAALDYDWSKLDGKTVLISGGTGFIGQFIIEVFKLRNAKYGNRIRVISLSRRGGNSEPDVTYLSADVAKPITVDGKVDYVLHLASNTHPKQYAADPVGTVTTNIFGTYNLLTLALEKQVTRFLLASSVEIYGEGSDEPMTESYCGYIDCNTWRAGYNEAKRLSESLCQSFIAQHGVDCVIARLARCFGADKKADSKAMAQFMQCAVDGNDIVLKSKGEQRYSYCYVADAASGLIKVLLDGVCGNAYNVSDDDEGVTLGGYAKHIAGCAGKKVVFDLRGANNQGVSKSVRALINTDKLKALGWLPQFTVSDALSRTYEILKRGK